jgi:membrane-associated phospholipid phosphatase
VIQLILGAKFMQGSSLPVLIWLGFPRLGSDLCLLMAITLYVGNAMKDLVSSPRPLGLRYGSVRLVHIATLSEETKKNAEEFGLPSSHAMNTLCFNFYACHYLHKYGYFPDGAAIFMYSMVTLWVLWIAVSRVYLGLHTPIDILAGAVAGLAVLTAFISVENLIQDFIHLPHSWFYAIMISLMLLRLHPTPASHTPSYEFTTSFVGVAFGVILAVSMKPEYFHHKEDISEIFSKGVHVALAKLCCGFTIVLVTKLVTRRVCSALLPIAYHWFPASIRQAWQPPVCAPPDPVTKLKKTIDGTQWADIDATVRFFSYASIGFAVCYIAPVAFEILDYV